MLNPATGLEPVVVYAKVPLPFSVTLCTVIVPQLETFTGCGATKSLTSAGNDADERLFRNALPSASHVPAGKTCEAVRLIAASPKVPAGNDAPEMGSETVVELTAPWAKPAAERSTRLPQHGNAFEEKQSAVVPLTAVTHLSRPSTGLP